MKPTTYWQSLSDGAALAILGEYIKHTRLAQNKTQAKLAEAAGIHRQTVTMIEAGNGGTLASLIKILRMLGKMEKLETFEVDLTPSPIQLADMMA
ncbi:MAG: helix-turn-helix transcriptional regulator, partial [Flammeovirgaceae bacterium]